MRLVSDLEIHSKYARAVSKAMTVPEIFKWAKYKGINLIGTGDFTHPFWLSELKQNLKSLGNGLFQFKGEGKPSIYFLLTAEISSIYTQGGRGRRIHNIVLCPSFEIAERINSDLSKFGNLYSDGRPIIGISAKDLLKIVLSVNQKALLIPAHIWTPWFSLFGSNSGFDSIEECFEDLSKYVYAVETGLSCYDKKTEVLTDKGWKKFSEITYSDKICSLNSQNNVIEFQRPKKIFKKKYKGKMYRLKTKRVDIFVTPNHNLFYSPCDFRNPKPYILKEARFLFGKSKRFKKNGIWFGQRPKYFTLPSVKIKHGSRYYSGFRNKEAKPLLIKPWLKFFGFWLAEGWTTEGKEGDFNVCLSNRNIDLLNEMKQILEGFGYSVYKGKNIIRVRDFQLFNYLKQFGKAATKFIPKEIKFMSKELLQILFIYYLKGDGHRYGRTKKGLSATTISKKLRDDLQEVALKLGFSAYYKLHNKKGTLFKSASQSKLYRQSADSWVIYFIRKNEYIILPSTIKKYNYVETWENYDDFVYCVSVPNRVIYIRRNGIPVWCGNSDPAMNWRLSQLDNRSIVSFSDAHSAPNLGRELSVFEIPEKEISYDEIARIIKEKDTSRFSYTVEFYPQEGMYHYDGHRNCNVRLSPEETRKLNKICPVCKKPLTVGVMHRVEDLADHPAGRKPEKYVPYKNLVQLSQIIAESLGVGEQSKQVQAEYLKMITQLQSEFEILVDHDLEKLAKYAHPKVVEGIQRVREGKVKIEPGYDGVYGTVKVFEEEPKPAQESLF